VEDPHLAPEQVWCDLDDEILYIEPCSSPFTLEGDLPDGYYSFEVGASEEAGNWDDTYNGFEVDTVAPKFVSGKPTGRLVSRYAAVKVTFDDDVYRSAKKVNIYKRESSTPLAVYREAYGKNIALYPNNSLRRGTGTR